MAGPGQARFYSSTYVQTNISSGSIGSGTTQFNVGTTTGAPGTPFVISVDQNTATEELMLVTNVSGSQYTVTRGVGGTAAVGHSNNAPVVHVMYAQDLTDASLHVGSFDNVHGLAVGALVVGTTSTQTLTNKTLTSPILNTPTISAPTITGTANTGPITSSGNITAVEFTPTGLTGATQASAYVGATLSGSPVSGTFVTGNFVIDQTGLIWVCTAGGTPGTWVSLVNVSATQTLNNKTINAGTFTGAGTGSGSLTLTLFVRAEDFQASGKGVATAASSYAGATASGSPSSGNFIVGDYIVDQTGTFWVCTVAGNPGTWVAIANVSSAQTLTNKTLSAAVVTNGLSVTGITGATAASRYVGATTSGAPTSGTFQLGDHIVDQSGNVWICTTAGSPGTWNPVGGGQGVTTAATTTSSNGTPTAGGTAEVLDAVLGNYQFNVIAGRRYRVTLEGMQGSATANDLYRINIRNSGSASAPTITSTVNASTQWFCPASGGAGQCGIPGLTGEIIAASTGVNTIGVSYNRQAGTGAITPVGARWLYAEDLGNV